MYSSSNPYANHTSRVRASTGLSPIRQKPHVLMSSYVPSTVHTPDLFFAASEIPHGRMHHSNSAPPLHRALTSPSDIPSAQSPPEPPPKLPLLPFPNGSSSNAPNESGLEAVLALSRSESTKQAAFLEKLSTQEEEDLARALEESKLYEFGTNSYTSASSQGSPTVYTIEAGPSTPPAPWTLSPGPSTLPLPVSATMDGKSGWNDGIDSENPSSGVRRSSSHTHFDDNGPLSEKSQMSEDEALARKLMKEEETFFAGPSSSGLPSSLTTYSQDEALARKLAAEEEEAKFAKANDSTSPPMSPPLPHLPTYADAISPAPTQQSPLPSASSSIDQSLAVDAHLLRSNSKGSETSRTSSYDSSSSSIAASTTHTTSSPIPSTTNTPLDDTAVVNMNHYVDRDLLRGVSVGFIPPTISYALEPMQGVMPNIISLPYGRCPPLHIQAPNWRHLLKLMAWLSGTRIEPTLEAVAVSKAEALYLRTVVQFIKPTPTFPDWRTVLWFTIDHPVPSSMPGARKFTNNDVDVLPFSYTLSTIPALLRDSADTPVSKTYTIPHTDSVPYPPLPITFPNLAMYLQAVLEESRRYINDSSSGIRKLAKMVDLCYPSTLEPELPGSGEGRSGARGLIKKVWPGRGIKNNKKGRGGNEDTYELVTPFVPDQWG